MTLDSLQEMLGQMQTLLEQSEEEPPAPETPAETAPSEPPANRAAAPHGAANGRVEVAAGGLLDVHVRNTDIAAVLEMLSYQAQANIVTSTQVSGLVSANLYSVTLEEALDAILTPNQYAYIARPNMIFVGTREEIATLEPPAPPETRVFRLQFIRSTEAAAAVRSVLSTTAKVVEGGSDPSGGGGDTTDIAEASSDYLLITDTPERLDAARDVLAQIDRRPRQVLIEATVLRATLDETNQFGIDFTMLAGVDFQNVSATSTAAADLTLGPLADRQFQDTSINVQTNFAGNVGDGAFNFGMIRDQIATFVRALEEVTDVVVVANPKIIALNKQEGEVIVGRRDGYITTTVTQTAAVQTVEFLETGTQIKFRPIINDDGTVRIIVHPKDSNGGLNASNLPFEETTEAHADIIIEDGNTLLIGGLFRERTVQSKTQIPVLGDLPGVGLLFGSTNDQTIREEVIILLTVHVIKESDHERDQFRRLLEDVERIRVGSRMGLVATGRERLAQAYYHEALRQLQAGHPERALLNARMTLNNQPKHVQALKLVERLTHERAYDADGTRARDLVWELIDAGPPPTPEFVAPFGRPEVSKDLRKATTNPDPATEPAP